MNAINFAEESIQQNADAIFRIIPFDHIFKFPDRNPAMKHIYQHAVFSEKQNE